jgi:hypothetical protein
MSQNNQVYAVFLGVIAFFLFSLFSSKILYAQDITGDALDVVAKLTKEFSGMGQSAKCQIVEQSLAQREKYFSAKKNNHQRVYGGVMSRLDLLKFYLDSEGVDTSNLLRETNVYKSKVDGFQLSYLVFEEKLSISKAKACGDNPENFNLALEESRLALVNVRKSTEELNMHYMTDLRKELYNLKIKLKAIYE